MNPDLLRMDKQEAAMKKLIDTEDLCLADDICIPIAFEGDTEATQYIVRTILSRDDISIPKSVINHRLS